MSLPEQMGNIGSEVYRSINKFNKNGFEQAFNRALELYDAAIADKRWKHRLKEILRSRELFCSLFFGELNENEFKDTSEFLNKYFTQFGFLVNLKK